MKKEKYNGEKKMPEEGFSEFIRIVIPFLFIAYGFLLLLSPERYGLLDLPLAFNQFLGIIMIIVGFYFYQRRKG